MPSTCRRLLRAVWLGVVAYDEALRAQKHILAHVLDHPDAPGFLILLQHPPILTIGRGARSDNILVPGAVLAANGIRVVEVDRGGDITYHGPGQIVGYPIIDLQHHKRDVHSYLRSLEEVIIRGMASIGIAAGRIEGRTGVWVGGEKIASIGVGIRRWVTYHGFALNVVNDLTPFSYINPCGLQGVHVTSVASISRPAPSLESLGRELANRFVEVFDFREVDWVQGGEGDFASIVEAALGSSPVTAGEGVASK